MGNRYAVGYIRGRFIRKKRTPDWEMQRIALKEYAEANCYVYLATFGEAQTTKKGIKITMPMLIKALELSKKKKATLLYVDLRNWRRSPVFFKFVTNNVPSRTGFKMTAIRDDRVIAEIERLARYDKCFRADGKPVQRRSALEKQDARYNADPGLEWKDENDVSTKRYMNSCHLYKGPEPIYRVIQSLAGKTDREIADILHGRYYVTIDGKRWQKENVRRTRGIIESAAFQQFVAVKEASQRLG